MNSHSPDNPSPPMTGRRTYVVACLAGHGIGPEITAAASRALAGLAREHGFAVEELHPPFDTEALTRSGHLLPAATRQATSSADAVLVAGDAAPALEGLRAALDLGARVTRVLDDTGEATDVRPAPRRRGRLDARPRVRHRAQPRGAADVGGRVRGLDGPGRPARRSPSRRRGGARAAPRGAPPPRRRVDRRARRRGRARRRRSPRPRGSAAAGGSSPPRTSRPTGPSLFGPAQGTASDLAGHGVADPSPMLLATALLLSEGLGRVAAGEALEESLTAALQASRRPSERAGPGVTATTREFVDAVLGLLRERPPRHGVRAGGRPDEDDRRRRDPPLARGRGRRGDVRHPRRRDHADVRRDGARDDRPARPRPPRAGRGAHGAGLRPRVGPGRRRDRDVGPRRDEPRHADRRRVDGLDAARLHHGPGALEPDRHGRASRSATSPGSRCRSSSTRGSCRTSARSRRR